MKENQKITDKKVKIIDFIYYINEAEKTASLFSYNNPKKDLVIQRSITYNSMTYAITSIFEGVFQNSCNIKSISFAEDSELRTIGKGALSCSLVESISLPSSLVELKDEWCDWTPELNKVNISSKNPNYKIYEDKYIIGKSSIQQTNFDVLVFCVRNNKKVKIPNFIKKIGPYAFNCCGRIQDVEISSDSKLQTIGKHAFSFSSIKSFTIPSQVTEICDFAFAFCEQLMKIEIPSGSKLQIIKENAFTESMIKSFTIFKQIKHLDKNVFSNCYHLQIIEFDENIQIKNNDLIEFDGCKQVILMIPNNAN